MAAASYMIVMNRKRRILESASLKVEKYVKGQQRFDVNEMKTVGVLSRHDVGRGSCLSSKQWNFCVFWCLGTSLDASCTGQSVA